MFLSIQAARKIEKALGPEATMPLVEAFEAVEEAIKAQKTEVKSDLLVELATKADIAELRGATKADIAMVKTDIVELRGELKTEITDLRGDLKRLEMAVKVLAFATILGIATFSPAATELIKLLK